ncbi:MAG: hypothetical protein NC453_25800 [Muribaculum sp.]|nr:hypothetical protein [Muribaculum sp.]
MAIPIKQVPILSGQIAEDFIREAEENEKLPRHLLSEESKARVRKMLRQIDEYVPSWRRKE